MLLVLVWIPKVTMQSLRQSHSKIYGGPGETTKPADHQTRLNLIPVELCRPKKQMQTSSKSARTLSRVAKSSKAVLLLCSGIPFDERNVCKAYFRSLGGVLLKPECVHACYDRDFYLAGGIGWQTANKCSLASIGVPALAAIPTNAN